MTDDVDRSDEDLRALLRAHDPARALPPADPTGVARLLEDTMNRSAPARDRAARRAGARRAALVWGAAAAVAAVVAGVFVVSGLGGSDEPAPTAGETASTSPTGTASTAAPDPSGSPSSPSSPSSGSNGTTTLTLPGGAPARCMVPSADVLARQQTAFEGTVTSVEDGVAVLETQTVLRGEPGPEVDVTIPTRSLQALIGAPAFEVGKPYLVAATDGKIAVCGFSGPATDDLRALYMQAFPQ